MTAPFSPNPLHARLIPAALSGTIIGAGIGLYTSTPNLLPFLLAGGGTTTVITLYASRQSQRRSLGADRQEVSSQELAALQDSKIQANPGNQPHLSLGEVPLTPHQETLHILLLGRSGTGKSQGICQLLSSLRSRNDFRTAIFDRQGEMLERFFQSSDLIFNPRDARSIGWCHINELPFLDAEDLAASLLPIPENAKDPIWYEHAQKLMAVIWERTNTNQQVWQILNSSQQDIAHLVRGTSAARVFDDPRLAASVLFSLKPATECYKHLTDSGEPFSFFRYGQEDDSRWLFLPLLNQHSASLKGLFSMATDLIARGILSRDSGFERKTALIIDELGGTQKQPNLPILAAEGRKRGAMLVLGTQSEAQIDEVYGEKITRILLQNTFTKVIFNCPDDKTSRLMAETIGKRRFWEKQTVKTYNPQRGEWTYSDHDELREEYIVQPLALQTLPDLQAYLLMSDPSPVARIQIPLSPYPAITPNFMPRSIQA